MEDGTKHSIHCPFLVLEGLKWKQNCFLWGGVQLHLCPLHLPSSYSFLPFLLDVRTHHS